MKILHVIPSVDPRQGGPMEGVRQRGLFLISQGHEVEVVSLDAPNSKAATGFPLKTHAIGPASTNYGLSLKLVPWLKRNAGDYDAVVVNGIWQFHSLATWFALRKGSVPYFVFTHGMLDPWFKQAYPLKHLKKWLYWPWAEYRVLRDASGVLFTCEEERLRAKDSFWLYRAKEMVVAYGAASPPSESTKLKESFLLANPELRDKRLFLFLSRIHEKKGCDLLIAAFAAVCKRDPSLHLVFAGPGHPGLITSLQRKAVDLGIDSRISWLGMLQGDLKWGAFCASEAFVLPSHQENFGIAVVEALGCGLPVLISDKVNIWREIASDGAGLVKPDSVDGVLCLLDEWLSLNVDERRAMGLSAKACFSSRFTISAMATSLLTVLNSFG